MDVTALAVDINNLKLSNDVGISVLKKAMDVTKEQSSALLDEIKELELSINPAIGSNVNTRI
ncbi:MAG: putative motility protein [Lachnospiraceae bacterium]|nr:MAG: putative motility protein [Lachnospiraceae bacterium]